MSSAHPSTGSADALEYTPAVSRTRAASISRENGLQSSLELADSDTETLKRYVAFGRRQRNAVNDPVCRLPIELRVLCFSFLPLPGILRASVVCSSWAHLIENTPSLWSHIDLSTSPMLSANDFRRALQLSQGLPLRVDVQLTDRDEMAGFDEGLLPHMHRLRTLRMEHARHVYGYDYKTLAVPAPELKVFTYLGSSRLCYQSPELFQGIAPMLHTVTMCVPPFFNLGPFRIAALQNVTTLSFIRPNESSRILVPAIIRSLPNLCTLHLESDDELRASLPPLPETHPLKRLFLKTALATGVGKTLYDLGYLRVERVEVEGCSADVIAYPLREGDPARSLAMGISVAGGTVTVSVTPSGGVSSTSGGAVLLLCALAQAAQLEEIFRPPATSTALHFGAITALSFPRDLPSQLPPHRLLWPGAPLPRLDTLTIVCGASAGSSILDPQIFQQCGILQAPVLRRLALVRDGRARHVAPVYLRDLRRFVTQNLEMNQQQLPELSIDGDVEIVECDDDGSALQTLSSCVGSLIVGGVVRRFEVR